MEKVFMEVDIWKCLEKETSKEDFIKYYALLTYLLPMLLTLIGNTYSLSKMYLV